MDWANLIDIDGKCRYCGRSDVNYKDKLVAILEGLEIVKPKEAAELSELHLRAIGERIADAARIGARFSNL